MPVQLDSAAPRGLGLLPCLPGGNKDQRPGEVGKEYKERGKGTKTNFLTREVAQ